MSRHIRPPRHAPGRPLSLAQKRALVALVRLCPELGSESGAPGVAYLSGLKPNVSVLALHGLQRRQLAVRHGGKPEAWAPTMSGRAMAKYVRAREPRSAPVGEFRTSDG
ncbi:MAG TPA: hypothetical protein VGW75_09725 [Solirubrobacteraceae bacterium]|jgi:hypothetical protein|nr:hypothetical protein [Solirubrobacteraceae bacterium]